MKTNTQNHKSGLGSTSAQLSSTSSTPAPETKPEAAAQPEKKDTRLPINAEARKQNRTLPLPKVLNLLHAQLPAAYRLAEVVGGRPDSGWVWVSFPDRPSGADDLGRWRCHQELAQLGFHWNRERQAWQHPCGKFSLGSQTDLARSYGQSCEAPPP